MAIIPTLHSILFFKTFYLQFSYFSLKMYIYILCQPKPKSLIIIFFFLQLPSKCHPSKNKQPGFCSHFHSPDFHLCLLISFSFFLMFSLSSLSHLCTPSLFRTLPNFVSLFQSLSPSHILSTKDGNMFGKEKQLTKQRWLKRKCAYGDFSPQQFKANTFQSHSRPTQRTPPLSCMFYFFENLGFR